MADKITQSSRTVRVVYSIMALTVLFATIFTVYYRLKNSLAERRVLYQLERIKTADKLQKFCNENQLPVSNDNLADICIRNGVEAFFRKDFSESEKFFKIVTHLDAHIELRTSALIGIANVCFFTGETSEGFQIIDAIIANKETPESLRAEAERIKRQVQERRL